MHNAFIENTKVKLHEWNIRPKKQPRRILPCEPDVVRYFTTEAPVGKAPVTWTITDLAKAGCLLCTPQINVVFENEQEMRRVYTLIYDVFRYKNVLSETLEGVQFFQVFPELEDKASKVWLLVYDFYHRSFLKRDPRDMEPAEEIFERAGLPVVEKAVWSYKVKLAAALARMRIKNSALRLNELLPRHLRESKMISNHSETPMTCWINIKKVKNFEELKEDLRNSYQLKCVEGTGKLAPNTFKIDKVCPQFLIFHASVREEIAQSDLVQKRKLIVQDRSFCIGPATFGKVLDELELRGCVIQTHVNSPRTTAYLAVLLSQNDKIKKVLAFSAGSRKNEYEKYFKELGINNIAIFSDRFIDTPPDANCLEEVAAVFATPPNSYSAVADPIDLVCSRGGDLSMLEILTETEQTGEGKKRVESILEEQRRTLQYAMSRPQIQFVLYETHSELNAENDEMVQRTIREINKIAKLHHAAIQGKLRVPNNVSYTEVTSGSVEINNNEKSTKSEEEESDTSSSGSETDVSRKQSVTSQTSQEILKDVVVPPSDIFDQSDLPDLCPNQDCCMKLKEEGCFLSLLKRKQVIRMDNKTMIKMAEDKGLFGDNSTSMRKSAKVPKKKIEAVVSPPKCKRRLTQAELERIAAPTQAFVGHCRCKPCVEQCPKKKQQDAPVQKDFHKSLAKIKRSWQNYKKKYARREKSPDAEEILKKLESHKFDITKLRFKFSRKIPKLGITSHREVISVEPKPEKEEEEENLEEGEEETNTMLNLYHSSRVYLPKMYVRDLFSILNSLTSQDVRKLVSTSYRPYTPAYRVKLESQEPPRKMVKTQTFPCPNSLEDLVRKRVRNEERILLRQNRLGSSNWKDCERGRRRRR